MELTQADIIAVQELQHVVNEMADLYEVNRTSEAAEHLTCSELNALARVFRNAGRARLAHSFVEAHANKDEEGDLHHGLDLQAQIYSYVASL